MVHIIPLKKKANNKTRQEIQPYHFHSTDSVCVSHTTETDC